MSEGIWKLLIVSIVIGFGVNVLASLIIGWDSFVSHLKDVSPWMVPLGFSMYVLVYSIDTLRLIVVSRRFGYRVKLKDAFKNSVQGYLFSYLTPMAMGGQPFQIYHLVTLGVKSEDASGLILSRFVEYLLTSVVISLVFYKRVISILKENLVSVFIVNLGFTVSVVFSLLFSFSVFRPHLLGAFFIWLERTRFGVFLGRIFRNERWGESIHGWTLGLKRSLEFLWRKNKLVALLDTVLGLSVMLVQALSLYFPLSKISEVSYFDTFVLFVFLNLVVYYVPTPGASGSIEGAYSMVYSALTRFPEGTLTAVIVWRFATYYLQILFGILFGFGGGRKCEGDGGGGDLQQA